MRLPPPLITAAFVAAQRIGVQNASSGGPAKPPLSGPRRVVCGALCVAGAGLYAATFTEFSRARTTIDPRAPHKTSALVTGGPFRVSRNPIYLADLLFVAAGAVGARRWWTWLTLPAFVAAMEPQLRAEEGVLSEKFGADYDEYRARVRRWV